METTSTQKTEIVVYQTTEIQQIEVRITDDTVWLTQAQIATMFGVQKAAISKHLKNIFASGELMQSSVVSILETTASDGKKYATNYYNLDAILSIGYRVNSIFATRFRIWANHVLKEYIVRGAAVNHRLENVESRLLKNEQHLLSVEQKMDSFFGKNLPPKQGIFFNGQVLDAYQFAVDLIMSAKRSIVLIDNYIDTTTLLMLAKRNAGVSATVYTRNMNAILQQDIAKFNAQYTPIQVKTLADSHDRFFILDDTELYLLGASLKDLGKKWFAFSKIDDPSVLQSIYSRLDCIK